MVRSKQLKDKIKTEISSLLNIKDPTPNSKLYGLIEGLVNDLDNFEENELSVLNNMYLETCTEEYLDLIAAQEGIQRHRTTSFKFSKESQVLSLVKTDSIPYVGVLKKGASYKLNDYFYLNNLEEIDINSTPEASYISAEIKVVAIDNSPFDLKKDSTFFLEGSNNLYVTVNEDIYIPVIEETLSDYRSRIIYSRLISKFGSENAIKLCIASSSFIDNYQLDYSSNPISILLFNRDMIIDDVAREDIILYSKGVIETEINRRKSDGTAYELKLPIKNSFVIELTPRVLNAREMPTIIYDFSSFIKDTYIFNSNYTVNVDLLKLFLTSNYIDLTFLEDYNITFKKMFMNFSIPANNNTIQVYPGEYPYLESISLVP